MKKRTLDNLLRELYDTLNHLYGKRLDRLVLYGSHARGQAHPASDVDILVVLKGPVKRPGLEIDRMMVSIYALNLKYDDLISVVPISQEDFLSKQSPLLMNVRREGIHVEPINYEHNNTVGTG